MKKITLLLFVTSFFFACNSPEKKENSTDSTGVVDEHDHATNSAELALNNGNKWKADSITTHNVVGLKTTADMFRVQPFPSVENYQLLGSDLSNDLDTLLQQCKMKGADHDALHKWLEPILNQAKELKNLTDTAKGKEIFKAVDNRIDAYRNFFE